MSLFDDDFYAIGGRSSSRRAKGRHEGKRKPWRRRRNSVLVFLFGLAAGGVLLLGLMTLFGASGGENQQVGIPALAPTASENMDQQVIQAANEVRPAIVSVLNEKSKSGSSKVTTLGLGSGVIFKKQGNKAYIITNNHVVSGGNTYDVVLSSGMHKKAKVIGSDRITDLAVLQVNAGGIQQVAQLGDSGKLQYGETAIAIGNPLGLGYSQTVTMGIISSPHRTIPISLAQNGVYDWSEDMIQTDAAINEGNSGGALVDLEGRVIGINSAKVADVGVEGLGFAIPINQVKPVVATLMKDGKIVRPFMGIAAVDLTADPTAGKRLKLPVSVKDGVLLMSTTGAAAKAGLQKNDVVVELDKQPIHNMLDLRKYLYDHMKIGQTMKVTYYRVGQAHTAELTLAGK